MKDYILNKTNPGNEYSKYNKFIKTAEGIFGIDEFRKRMLSFITDDMDEDDIIATILIYELNNSKENTQKLVGSIRGDCRKINPNKL